MVGAQTYPGSRSGSARAAVGSIAVAEQEGTWPNFGSVARLSAGFFAVFFSFNTTQGLMPWLLQELGFGQLGYVSMMVLYLFFFFSCAMVPPLLKRWDPRRALPAASLTYALFTASAGLVASGALPSRVGAVVLLAASALCGVGAAGLWCCQGVLMAQYAPKHLLNRFVALFLIAWQLGTLFGTLLAKELLERTTASISFLVLSGISCLGTAMLTGLPAPVPSTPEVRVATGVPPPLAAAAFAAERHPFAVELWKEMRLRLWQPLALLRSDGRTSHIALLSFLHAAVLNALPSVAFPLCAAANHQEAAVGAVAVAAGAPAQQLHQSVAAALACASVGRVAGALAFAPFADRFGRRSALALVSGLLLVAMCCLELEARGTCALHISHLRVGAFTLGLANMFCRGSLISTISALYKTDSVYAVVLMQLGTSLGSVAGFLCFPRMSLHAIFAIAVGGYAAAAAAAASHKPLFASSAQDKDG